MSSRVPIRHLVAPTFQSLFQNNPQVTAIDPGLNRFTSPWNYGSQYMLYGWAYPVSPAALGIPSRLHVVGNAINRSPLQLSIPPGNNIATVIPAAGEQFSVTQVTRGDIAYVRKGDYAFLLPQEITPRVAAPLAILSCTRRCRSGSSIARSDRSP